MAKTKTIYTCTECGGQSPKWQGQCPSCNAWNTLVETIAESAKPRFASLAATSTVQMLHEVEGSEESRIATDIGELDRVLAAGWCRGRDADRRRPGIGKSTLLLQAMAGLSGRLKTLYVSGEESARQVALRARRLSLPETNLPVLPEIRLEAILAQLAELKPDVAVIDSIQTVYSEALTSPPARWRRCASVRHS